MVEAILDNVQFTKIPDAEHNSNLSEKSKAEYRPTALSSANLTRASLISANLEGIFAPAALFDDAKLMGAVLSRGYLCGTIFTDANLTDAKFIGAFLSGVNFSRANLSKADLSGARLGRILLDGTRREDIRSANFSKANLSGANLSEADLTEANFDGANLSEADLTKTNFIGAENLTPKQIKSAKNWKKAYYDSNLCQQLGLPPSKNQDSFEQPTDK